MSTSNEGYAGDMALVNFLNETMKKYFADELKVEEGYNLYNMNLLEPLFKQFNQKEDYIVYYIDYIELGAEEFKKNLFEFYGCNEDRINTLTKKMIKLDEYMENSYPEFKDHWFNNNYLALKKSLKQNGVKSLYQDVYEDSKKRLEFYQTLISNRSAELSRAKHKTWLRNQENKISKQCNYEHTRMRNKENFGGGIGSKTNTPVQSRLNSAKSSRISSISIKFQKKPINQKKPQLQRIPEERHK